MMIINRNLAALNANRNLKSITTEQAQVTSRLSSGLKINSAADDVAGLAISERMKAQIRGMQKAEKNVADGINLINTMDSSMNGIQEMMQRQRELMLQGLNDTYSDEDKDNIKAEIDQLTEEINAQANKAEFNKIPLLNVTSVWDSGSMNTDMFRGYVSNNSIVSDQSLIKQLTLTNDDSQCQQSYAYSTGADTNMVSFNIERYILDVDPSFENFMHNQLFEADGTVTNANATRFATTIAEAMENAFKDNGVNFTFKGEYLPDGKISFTILNPDNGSLNMGGCPLIPAYGLGHYYLHMSCSPDAYVGNGEPFPGDLWIQGGSDEGEGMYISRYDCTSKALGIDNLVLKPIEAAEASLDHLDTALGKVSAFRSRSGAQQNRLEHMKNSLAISFENLEDANSRIADADMAREAMEYAKTNVLQQASLAMLVNANVIPQRVLQLLS